ncbi:MAG: proline dehydrogenase family protein [Thiobacillaceae bacterium]|nr:proline dehydrogenase family protein [Thiobacillaceae bacterium]
MPEGIDPVVDEALIRAIGERLLAAARAGSDLFDRTSLRGWLLTRALTDARLRTGLFRFVDVLPQLDSDAQVAEHLQAYLQGVELAGAMGRLIRLGERPGFAFAVRRAVARLARLFLVEETPAAIARLLAQLQRRGLQVSLDAVGEAVLTEAEAEAHAARVLGLIDRLAGRPGADVSLKLSALTARFEPIDPEGTLARLWPRLQTIAAAAQAAGVSLTLDMEQSEFKPLIQAAAARLRATRPQLDLGVVVQAYLREAQADLETVLALARTGGRRLRVRLVKGAYWDYELAYAAQRAWRPAVLTERAATDAQFERLSRALMAARDAVYPMIASHNPRSLAHAIACAQALGLAAEDWEVQMLHGMAGRLAAAVQAEGVRVRLYVPSGDLIGGIAYLIRRLLENTANTSALRLALHGAEAALLLGAPRPEPEQAQAAAAGGYTHAPLTDFSREPQRAALRAALAAVRTRLGQDYPLPGPGGGEWIVSTNPARPAEVVGRVQAATPAAVAQAVEAATAAFEGWRALGFAGRSRLLEQAAALLERRRHEFAAWIVLEAGKHWREADAEVAEAIDAHRYYAAQARALEGWRPTEHLPGELNDLRYEPVGPTAVIAPWNFPLAILGGMSAAALAAGCPVLLKPASLTPVIAWHYRLCLLEAGIPPAVVGWLPGAGGTVGEALVAQPQVAAVAFTGSRAVGLRLLSRAHSPQPGQRHIRRVALELGGKNALIVDDDADLDEAVGAILASAFGYQGQKCSAAARLITVGRVHGRLLERLAQALAAHDLGPPEEPAFSFGPLIDAQALSKAQGYLDLARGAGHIYYQGPPLPVETEGGHYFPPVLVTDVDPAHRLAREELFCPILTVLAAPDFDTALAWALDSDYALTGGVMSRHPGHLALARERFRVGNLYLNRRITGARIGIQPFGGTALSGSGIPAGGPDYLKQFLWSRCVAENTVRHGFVPQL